MTRADAFIVVDLGFGDAGKGTVVDYLVRERGADLVVRFNGGAQAGHNVVTPDGRHHTFAQLGAGTFVPGVRTHLGPAFVLHPGALEVEAGHLARSGVPDALRRLTIDARAPVITPFQQAAVRLRERARGAAAHGTTGVGVGEVRADEAAGCDDVVVAGELGSPEALRRKLRAQQERKRAELAALGPIPDGADELAVLDDPAIVERVVERWRPLADRIVAPGVAERLLRAARCLVLEGAQGVLLDERWGFHPHTTWSDCTFAGAEALIPDRERFRLGVVRAYATRHGAGPFPTERPGWDLPEPHNSGAGWQGRFRVGALDGVLLRYAVAAVGGVDGAAVTCLDRPIPGGWRGAVAYRDGPRRCAELPLPADLAGQEALGRWLLTVTPELEPGDPLAFVAERAGPVVLASSGPTAADKTARWPG